MKNLFRNALLVVGLSAFVTACGDVPTPPKPPEVVIPATTKVLDKTAQAALETVQPNSLTFAGSQPIATGDVVVSAPTINAPNGFLRKVTAVRNENGKTILETRQASLNQAIKEGSVLIEKELSSADIQAAQLTHGVRMVAPGVALTPRASNTTFSFDKVIYDKDGDEKTTNDQVKLTGMLDLKINFVLDAAIHLFEANHFLAKAIFTEKSNLTLKGKENWAVDKKITVATIRFSPIDFSIGPVPVHMRPIITLEVGIKGSVGGEVDVSVTQTFVATAGVEYRGEWRNLSDLTNNFSIDSSTLKFEASTKAYADLKFSLLFYELVEVFIRPEVFVRLDAQYPRKPFLKLEGGFGADAGVAVSLLDIEYSSTIFQRTFPIGQSANNAPTIGLELPATGDLNRPTRLIAFANDSEDGSNLSINWTSSLSSDGPVGTGREINKAFTTPGVRTLTVTTTDSDGASISQSKTINIVNTAPKIYISEPSTDSVIYKDSSYTFVVNAEDINEPNDQLACSGVTWTSSVLTDAFPKIGCNIDAVFSSVGTRTLTMVATDPQGLTNSKTVSINVLPTPANQLPNEMKISSPLPTVNLGTVNGIVTLLGSAKDPEGGVVTLEWAVAMQEIDANGNPVTAFGTEIKLSPDASNKVNLFQALGFDPTSVNSTSVNIRVTLLAKDPQGNTARTSVILRYIKLPG